MVQYVAKRITSSQRIEDIFVRCTHVHCQGKLIDLVRSGLTFSLSGCFFSTLTSFFIKLSLSLF